jgi:GR25 family glycosyltransferase involved in LPS biosynthesis
MIFDYFDGGFYLNLDKRTERRDAFEKRSKEAGFEVERFSAIQLKEEDVPNPFNNGEWHIKISCTYSHFEMIREAKRRGWKNCVIFEDDCVFEDGFVDKVKKCIDEGKDNLEIIDELNKAFPDMGNSKIVRKLKTTIKYINEKKK